MISAVFRWAVLALLGVLITITNVLFSPIIALFIGRDGYLPWWLSWFQTPDNPAIGDAAFQRNQMAWTLKLPAWLARYCLGVGWALRNPAYGYDQWAGFVASRQLIYTASGNEQVNLFRSANGQCTVIEGYVFRQVIAADGKDYFQLTILRRWSASRAWRISFGWTLSAWDRRPGNVCRVNTTINPWMDCRDGSA